MFGNNAKAQLAARTMFGLAHRHSDILHDGWKNILDCMLQLFRAKLLAEVLVMVCPVLWNDLLFYEVTSQTSLCQNSLLQKRPWQS